MMAKIEITLDDRLSDMIEQLSVATGRVTEAIKAASEKMNIHIRLELLGFNSILIPYMINGYGQWYRDGVECDLPDEGYAADFEWRCTFGK